VEDRGHGPSRQIQEDFLGGIDGHMWGGRNRVGKVKGRGREIEASERMAPNREETGGRKEKGQ